MYQPNKNHLVNNHFVCLEASRENNFLNFVKCDLPRKETSVNLFKTYGGHVFGLSPFVLSGKNGRVLWVGYKENEDTGSDILRRERGVLYLEKTTHPSPMIGNLVCPLNLRTWTPPFR